MREKAVGVSDTDGVVIVVERATRETDLRVQQFMQLLAFVQPVGKGQPGLLPAGGPQANCSLSIRTAPNLVPTTRYVINVLYDCENATVSLGERTLMSVPAALLASCSIFKAHASSPR